MKRPGTGTAITTPEAAALVQLLGGVRSGGVTVTRDEHKHLQRLYGFKSEKPNQKPPPPEPLPAGASYDEQRRHEAKVEAHARWKDPRPLFQAAADRNLLRHAEVDGLRLVAWLARYVEPGADPLKLLVGMAVDAGYDVSPSDCAWAMGEEEEVA